jgi:hypothetical protein
MTEELRVSQDIDGWCNKCELVLAHVIMSMKGTRPHRVKCKSCKDVHAYRVSKPKPRKKTSTTKKTKKAPRQTEYQKQMEGRDTSGAVPYAMSGSFAAEQIIDHKKFGIGLVVRTVGPTKIDVLFPDGQKTLVCNR